MEKLQRLFLWWVLKWNSFLGLLMPLLVLNFLPQPLQTNTWPLCCQIMCWLAVCKDLKAFSHALQGWTLSKCFLMLGNWEHGYFYYHALLHHQAVLDILLIPPLPLRLLLLIIILIFSPPILLLLPLFKDVWKDCRPSLLSYRDLKDRHWDVCVQAWPPPPPGSKIMACLNYSQVIKLWQVIQDSYFQMSVILKKTWRTNIKTEKQLKDQIQN